MEFPWLRAHLPRLSQVISGRFLMFPLAPVSLVGVHYVMPVVCISCVPVYMQWRNASSRPPFWYMMLCLWENVIFYPSLMTKRQRESEGAGRGVKIRLEAGANWQSGVCSSRQCGSSLEEQPIQQSETERGVVKWASHLPPKRGERQARDEWMVYVILRTACYYFLLSSPSICIAC